MGSSTNHVRSFLQTLSGNAQQAYRFTLAGALGAVFGLYFYSEFFRPFDHLRSANELWWARNLIAGAALGGMIGFFLNAADPLRDQAFLKLTRTAAWGALAGASGGMLGLVVGEWVLGTFQGGSIGRAVSWAILGLGIGLSQGIAYQSRQRLIYGLIGGGLGGLVGGYLFEVLREGMGNRYDLSQGLGAAILGGGLGLFLALVEQVLRRAWVVVLNGRQEGRAYLLSDGVSRLGLDERAEVGLFGDASVRRQHAEIERDGGGYRVRVVDPNGQTQVNAKPVTASSPLQDGDRLDLGQTKLIFRKR